MSTETRIDGLVAAIAASWNSFVKPLLWLPAEESARVDGKSYAPFYTNGAWSGWSEVPESSPPLDQFVSGWASFPVTDIEAIVGSGSSHAAVSCGPQAATINGVVFEQTDANTADTSVPNNATGYTGTNWQVRRGNQATANAAPLVNPTQGNNTARTETTVDPDLPDPSFGTIAGVADLNNETMRRNQLWTISNLTIGNRYYASFAFLSRPNSLTTATVIRAAMNGVTLDSTVFGVDGAGAILSGGIKRFGFTATAADIHFLKEGPDASGSYLAGMWVTDEGAP